MSSPPTTADYIIIGGGTSGLVVANRLTEDPNVHVIVLETGSNHTEDPRVNVPAFWTSLIGSELDWKYNSVPQVSNKTVFLTTITTSYIWLILTVLFDS